MTGKSNKANPRGLVGEEQGLAKTIEKTNPATIYIVYLGTFSLSLYKSNLLSLITNNGERLSLM